MSESSPLAVLTSGGDAPGMNAAIRAAVLRFPLARVLDESHALVDGTSPITQRRLRMMEAIEGVLGL